MVRIGLTILFAVAVVRSAFADEPAGGPRQLEFGEPADVGVDADRLDRAVSIVRHAVEDDEIPGAVVLVARRGRVILHEAFGFRDAERTQPMQTDSLFRMASNSKAVTAAGIMVLVEDGKLDLDAPLGTCLPAFDNDAWRPVTIRHLLTHTSGTRIKPLFLTPLLKSSPDDPQGPDLRLEVNRFAEIPPDEKPGTTYSYSNAGFNTLAAVIEQVAGSYKDHLHVYHNNGNWLPVDEGSDGMAEVEVLARYDYPEHKVDGGAAIWAYRPDEDVGRIINIGSHPEGSSDGEKLALTEACFLYVLAGTGRPQLKATLPYSEPRKMDRRWSDNKPEWARIGDRQYHHFAFDVSPDEPHVNIELSSDQNVDLHLFLSDKSLAFRKQATHFDIRRGAMKTIQRELTPGRWHVSVYCATTVDTINDPDSGFHRFVGDRSVLNGTAYTICVSR